MKKVALIFLFGLFCFTVPLEGNSQVVATVCPVARHVVVARPASVRVGYVWVDGRWNWNNARKRYVWRKGYWVRAKRGQVWIAGHWSKARRGWIWVPGYWRRG